jgi:hypothetical protein
MKPGLASVPASLFTSVVLLALMLGGSRLTGQDARPGASAKITFNRDIRPILSTCFRCHGLDESSRRGGMRLDLREEALRPRRNGAPLVPGKPDESLIVQRIFDTDPGRDIGSVADLCIIRSMYGEQINHDPAHQVLNNGSILPGRPSFGSWLLYGLGSESDNLPGFVVMVSMGKGGSMQPIAARQWSAGILPSKFQGVKISSFGDPVSYIENPGGITSAAQRDSIDRSAFTISTRPCYICWASITPAWPSSIRDSMCA